MRDVSSSFLYCEEQCWYSGAWYGYNNTLFPDFAYVMTSGFKNVFSYHPIKHKARAPYLWCMQVPAVKYFMIKHEDSSVDAGVELRACILRNLGL